MNARFGVVAYLLLIALAQVCAAAEHSTEKSGMANHDPKNDSEDGLGMQDPKKDDEDSRSNDDTKATDTEDPVLANPPNFPGTLPVTAPLQPIKNRLNIYSDFQNDWARHTEFTVLSKQAEGRAFSGTGGADFFAADDFYRTNRFDLFSHYVRAYDLAQVVPPTSARQITAPAGRALVALLDQHISDTDALMLKTLQAKGVFDNLSASQTAFINQYQAAEMSLIPGLSPDAIVARGLLKLNLLATSADAAVATTGASSNVGRNAAELIALSKRFDPVADVVANGVKVIGIISNVYASIAAGLGPQRYQGDITEFNQTNYDAFGAFVAKSAYFRDQKAHNIATLAKAGFTSSGSDAQDSWNAHLVTVALLVGAETDLDVAVRNGTATPQNPGAVGAALEQANTFVLEHAPQLAGLFGLSLGVPTEGAVLTYPQPGLLGSEKDPKKEDNKSEKDPKKEEHEPEDPKKGEHGPEDSKKGKHEPEDSKKSPKTPYAGKSVTFNEFSAASTCCSMNAAVLLASTVAVAVCA